MTSTLPPRSGRGKPLAYGQQCLDDDDRRAVLEVLSGDWLTQGPFVEQFERSLAEYFGVRHAVVCSNGTAALHLAAMALGWGAGDVVLVPAITFLASANCCLYVGAEPYFVDIDERTLGIDVDGAERAILRLRASGRRVRGIVAVDMAGYPCDWVALKALADRYGLDVIDDACHAMGASYAGGVKVGSCVHSRVSTLSFHPVKHLTTGEGGALLTNDSDIAAETTRLRSHGTVRGADRVAGWDGPWHYDMVEVGYNYRLTDLQSALGTSQLKKLDRFVARRREIAATYDRLFAKSDVFRVSSVAADVRHAYHLYIVRASFGANGVKDRRTFFDACAARGVQLQVHYRPVPLNTFYRRRGTGSAPIPVAQRYYEEAVSIPMFVNLTMEDVEYVVRTLHECA